jgi:hypothetical protein
VLRKAQDISKRFHADMTTERASRTEIIRQFDRSGFIAISRSCFLCFSDSATFEFVKGLVAPLTDASVLIVMVPSTPSEMAIKFCRRIGSDGKDNLLCGLVDKAGCLELAENFFRASAVLLS